MSGSSGIGGASFALIPPEIMVEIFHLSISNERGYQKELCLLGLVCRKWHDVVHSTAQLWNRIFWSDSPSLSSETLTKSGSLPLIIEYTEVSPKPKKQADLLALVTPLVRRWKVARLDLDGASQESWDNLLTPAPLLQELSLTVYDGHDHRWKYPGPHIDLFTGEAPRLERVRIDCVPVVWASPIFSNLTEMEFRHIDASVPQLLRMLSSCPSLRSLILAELLPVVDQASLQRVTLPFLSNFLTRDVTEDVSRQLVANLVLPAVRTFRFSCADSEGVLPIASFLQSHLLSMVPNILQTPITTLKFSGASIFLYAEAVFQDADLRFSLAVRNRATLKWDFIQWLSDVTGTPPTAIIVYGAAPFDDDTIHRMARWDNVVSFRTCASDDAPAFVDYLAKPLTVGKPGQWLFPNMTELTIQHSCPLTNILQMLQTRYNETSAVLPLETLHLIGLDEDNDTLKDIKRFLGNIPVNWNFEEVKGVQDGALV